MYIVYSIYIYVWHIYIYIYVYIYTYISVPSMLLKTQKLSPYRF